MKPSKTAAQLRQGAARKAWRTRRAVSAFAKARASEAASKEALRLYCEAHGWKLAFFEGPTGSPRTGIIDAIALTWNLVAVAISVPTPNVSDSGFTLPTSTRTRGPDHFWISNLQGPGP